MNTLICSMEVGQVADAKEAIRAYMAAVNAARLALQTPIIGPDTKPIRPDLEAVLARMSARTPPVPAAHVDRIRAILGKDPSLFNAFLDGAVNGDVKFTSSWPTEQMRLMKLIDPRPVGDIRLLVSVALFLLADPTLSAPIHLIEGGDTPTVYLVELTHFQRVDYGSIAYLLDRLMPPVNAPAEPGAEYRAIDRTPEQIIQLGKIAAVRDATTQVDLLDGAHAKCPDCGQRVANVGPVRASPGQAADKAPATLQVEADCACGTRITGVWALTEVIVSTPRTNGSQPG